MEVKAPADAGLLESEISLCRDLLDRSRSLRVEPPIEVRFYMHANATDLALPGWPTEALHANHGHTDQCIMMAVRRGFRPVEIFVWNPHAEPLIAAWRFDERDGYVAILPDARGRLYSRELGLHVGAVRRIYRGEPTTWASFYEASGYPVLVSDLYAP